MKPVIYSVIMKWIESVADADNFWTGSQWFMLYRRNRDFIMHFKQDYNFTAFFGELDKTKEYNFRVIVKEFTCDYGTGRPVILKWVDKNQMWFMLDYIHNKFICPFPDCKNVDLFFLGLDKTKDNEKIIEIEPEMGVEKWLT